MIFTRLHSLVVAILCLIALSSCAYAQENRWDIEATLAKDQFVRYEPIWIDIRLTNVTADTLRTHGLNLPNCREFKVELKDSTGQSLKQRWESLVVPAPGRLLLEPGQEDYGSFDLADLFGVVDEDASFALGLHFPFIPIGSYTVQVLFEGAASAELHFLVGEPSGRAHEALELINQAFAKRYQDNTSTAAVKFMEAAERFPDGPYAEKCYYLSLLYSPEEWNGRKQGTRDLTILKRTMLEKYPNSGHARDWIIVLTRGMEPEAERTYFDEFAAKHPNSRGAKYARVALEQLNSQKAGE